MKDKLCRKYIIQRADGSDINPNAKYFVIRYDAKAEHGYINRTILHKWCDYIREYWLSKEEYELLELADYLLKDIREETNKAFGKDEQTRTVDNNVPRVRLGSIDFTNLGEYDD